MGCPELVANARSAAGVAATGPTGFGPATVVLVGAVVELESSSFPRRMSQITKVAATAIATIAPIRTLDRRAQPVSRGSLTRRKNRKSLGGRKPRTCARLTPVSPRLVTSKARPQARTTAAAQREGRRWRRRLTVSRGSRAPTWHLSDSAGLQSDSTRAVSSVGRAPARQAGGHWFEPSTAHSRSKSGPLLGP